MRHLFKSKRLSGLYWLIVGLLVFTAVSGGSNGFSGIASLGAQSNGEAYMGAEACGMCHPEQYAVWNQSYHNNYGLINITDGVKYYWLSPPWLHDGETRIRTQAADATSGESCGECHTTGYDPDTGTWPGWNSTDEEAASKFLGVQCEVCHGAGMEMSIDYASDLCGMCHTGSHGQYEDVDMSTHNSSLQDVMSSSPADSCLACHSAQGALGLTVTTTTMGLLPISCVVCHSPHSATNEAQLREETPTDTCGTCHDYPPRHATEYTLYIEGPHEKAGVECTDCHGQGSHYAHGSESAYFNHTFAIYGTYLPYNQSDPLVCGQCHDQSWATQQLGIIQETVDQTIENVTEAISDAEAAVEAASQTSGVDQTKITQAQAFVDSATQVRRYVEGDLSVGFHNPETSFDLLSEAWRLAVEALNLANKAQQDALSGELSDVSGQLSDVQSQLASTQMYLYVGVTGAVIGGLIIGLLVGRRWGS